jgi:hypothetical protein
MFLMIARNLVYHLHQYLNLFCDFRLILLPCYLNV